jgi:hypothetical protein
MRARTRSIGSRSRARGSSLIFDHPPAVAAGFRSLKDSWADTTTPHGKLMVTVLGGLAEWASHPAPAGGLAAGLGRQGSQKSGKATRRNNMTYK